MRPRSPRRRAGRGGAPRRCENEPTLGLVAHGSSWTATGRRLTPQSGRAAGACPSTWRSMPCCSTGRRSRSPGSPTPGSRRATPTAPSGQPRRCHVRRSPRTATVTPTPAPTLPPARGCGSRTCPSRTPSAVRSRGSPVPASRLATTTERSARREPSRGRRWLPSCSATAHSAPTTTTCDALPLLQRRRRRLLLSGVLAGQYRHHDRVRARHVPCHRAGQPTSARYLPVPARGALRPVCSADRGQPANPAPRRRCSRRQTVRNHPAVRPRPPRRWPTPAGTGRREGAGSYSPRNLRWLVGLSPMAASSPTVCP